jgi:hypothetical protein
MDCVLLLTERFYTPLLGSNREPIEESFEEDPLDRDPFEGDPFKGDPFGSLLQPAPLMPLLPEGIYPLFEELYNSI